MGTFRHALDKKNRVTVPACWRVGGLELLHAVADEEMGILKLLPRDELVRTARMFAERPGVTPDIAREFRRTLYGRGPECKVDPQGRVLLPAEAIAKLGLADEVVLVGTGERIEVWRPEHWDAVEPAQMATFKQYAKEIGF